METKLDEIWMSNSIIGFNYYLTITHFDCKTKHIEISKQDFKDLLKLCYFHSQYRVARTSYRVYKFKPENPETI